MVFSLMLIMAGYHEYCKMNLFRKLWNMKNRLQFKGRLVLGQHVSFNQVVEWFGNGNIVVGSGCMFGYRIGGGNWGRCEIQTREKDASIIIGEGTLFNNNVFICARKSIVIGNKCLFGRNVTIMDHNAHGVAPSKRRTHYGTVRSVEIGNNVWLGNYVTVLPGTTIGDNSIIAVGSVVSGNIPANVIVRGNPGVIVKTIEEN